MMSFIKKIILNSFENRQVEIFQSTRNLDFSNPEISQHDLYQVVHKNISGFKFIQQTHEDSIVELKNAYLSNKCDAVFTRNQDTFVAVRTADCVPIILTNKECTFVAAIHCGWRGFVIGLLEKMILQINEKNLIAWIGPCISQDKFEVDQDVYARFIHKNKRFTYFIRYKKNKFFIDLVGIAQFILKNNNIEIVSGNDKSHIWCTYKNVSDFFSYRRGSDKGRMATFATIANKKI